MAGDCLDVFGAEPDASFDAFVSDFPSGTAFMARKWDHAEHLAADEERLLAEDLTRAQRQRDAWVKVWAARAARARRKAKRGAYALIWALPRTSGWTQRALDDAGWLIQDVITHVFAQGWPKGESALKPASEHWILARNGLGGELQIDASRVRRNWNERGEAWLRSGHSAKPDAVKITGAPAGNGIHANPLGSMPTNFVMSHAESCCETGTRHVVGDNRHGGEGQRPGGFGDVGAPAGDPRPAGQLYGDADVPTFDCLAGCDCGLSVLAESGGVAPVCVCGRAMWWACPVAQLDQQSGVLASGARAAGVRKGLGYGGANGDGGPAILSSQGPASRYFPCFSYFAKAPPGERQAGCEHLFWKKNKRNPFGFDRVSREVWELLPEKLCGRGNVHNTIKGLSFMRWICGLVTPVGGRVGDLTMGSGTPIALHQLNVARGLGASFLGSDICLEAVEIAEARLAYWRAVRHDVKPVKRRVEVGAEQAPAGQLDLLEGSR